MQEVDEAARADLDLAAARLRASGWAGFVTVDHLVESWRRLGQKVARYDATVDDYTNDLTSREGLHFLLQHCHSATAEQLAACLDPLDEQFRSGTDEDSREVLGRFYRVVASSGWWMRRIPKGGSLRAYLDQAVLDDNID